MIKLLSISSSPVASSSTDVLLKRVVTAISDNLTDGEEVALSEVRLNDLDFIPCQACGKSPEPDFCLYEDDLTPVYDLIAECDCLLFGSPVYFDCVSAQAKTLIDRCNCFRPPDYNNTDQNHDFLKRLSRKRPGAMILVGGERGWFEGARRVSAGFFKWIEIENEGKLIYRSPDFSQAGTAAEDSAILAEADALGGRLAGVLAGGYEPGASIDQGEPL